MNKIKPADVIELATADIVNRIMEYCFSICKSNEKIIDVDWNECRETLYFNTKANTYLIAIPHEGNEFHWLFRRGRLKGFDRWANSTEEEHFYSNFMDLFNRLKHI